MFIDGSILKNEEKITFMLRSLYQSSGYVRYKMSRFEEYDYYAVNRDFLVSDNIITFTDTNGRLMALKPDVTLSIIKAVKDAPGSVSKLYYDENVYRVSKAFRGFKEIMQAGIECIGDIGEPEVGEVLLLAAKSLRLISADSVLTISHQGIISELLGQTGIPAEDRKTALRFIGSKNLHELTALLEAGGAPEKAVRDLMAVLTVSGGASEAAAVLGDLGCARESCEELERLASMLTDSGYGDTAVIDFSVVNNMNYYNGIVFKGYVKGIPAGVLSGGQYDSLLASMGRKSRAVGFAVYTDLLERFEIKEPENA